MRNHKNSHPSVQKRNSIIITALFFAILLLLFVIGTLPPVIGLGYLGVSVLTAIVYWHDKSAAQAGGWRIPEATLHALSLSGGWPGAMVAMSHLRHKTAKESFRLGYRLTVLGNCLLLALLVINPDSQYLIKRLIRTAVNEVLRAL